MTMDTSEIIVTTKEKKASSESARGFLIMNKMLTNILVLKTFYKRNLHFIVNFTILKYVI